MNSLIRPTVGSALDAIKAPLLVVITVLKQIPNTAPKQTMSEVLENWRDTQHSLRPFRLSITQSQIRARRFQTPAEGGEWLGCLTWPVDSLQRKRTTNSKAQGSTPTNDPLSQPCRARCFGTPTSQIFRRLTTPLPHPALKQEAWSSLLRLMVKGARARLNFHQGIYLCQINGQAVLQLAQNMQTRCHLEAAHMR